MPWADRAEGGWSRRLRTVGALASAILMMGVEAAGQGPVAAPGPRDFASMAGDFDPGEDVPEYFSGRGDAPERPRVEMSLFDAAVESMTGDVYRPGDWHPLPLRTFFSEGWNEAWAAAPAGRSDTTPRHGWLGAFQGVFYRLWFTSVGYAHSLDAPYRGEGYTGEYSIFLPFNRRFELMLEVPIAAGNGTIDPRTGYTSNAGDLRIVPKVLLSESEAVSQTLSLPIRTPTGSPANGEGIASVDPRYEFWSNPFGSWVVRGGGGPFIPLNPDRAKATTSLRGDLAVGRYFRPHDVPFGDLVVYAASNFDVPLRGDVGATYVGVGPGTRFHLGNRYYFLHYWEFPVTGARPQDYLVQAALLKIF